ncbi:MAG: hypothetical protein JWR26_2098 [Pedosphaera sp.]|nr:hypothetical protein [Pedosphaera sp.]
MVKFTGVVDLHESSAVIEIHIEVHHGRPIIQIFGSFYRVQDHCSNRPVAKKMALNQG